MDNRKKKLNSGTAISLISSYTGIPDELDEEVYSVLKSKNFALLYQYYLNHNDKDRALAVLLERESKFRSVGVINEILRVLLYFQDYEGALEYISRSKQYTNELLHYEFLIQIHLAPKNSGCKDLTIFSLVKRGLEIRFDRSFIEIMKEYLKNNCGLCFHECLKKRMSELQEIIELNHYHKLNYKDSKFCYSTLPRKDVFLYRMIKTNPYIKKKYYIEYAEIFGIQKEDIINILKARFCNWAADIALFFGWIDENLRISYDKHKSKKPIPLNKTATWKYKKDEIYYFKNIL